MIDGMALWEWKRCTLTHRIIIINGCTLSAGANPTLLNNEGHSPLDIALGKGILASIRLLKVGSCPQIQCVRL